MKTPRYTATQVADALRSTRGMTYLAAKRLGCDPNTIMAYCRRYPTVEQAKQDARGELLDVAEVKLWQAVQEGQHWAICFALRMLGRTRGYTERQELTGDEGAPLVPATVIYLPSKALSAEQWQEDVKHLMPPLWNGHRPGDVP